MSSTLPNTQVDVLLTAADRTDADAVFAALEAVFPPSEGEWPREVTASGAEEGTPRPTVWSASFDAGSPGGHSQESRLRSPVLADLSGGPHCVQLLEDALGGSFTVEETGHVSGDQEVEIRLRLTNRG
jgi:hypothetical protein